MIDHLREENRVLREQMGVRQLRLNDHQRRRLTAKAKLVDRKLLVQVATIVAPERPYSFGSGLYRVELQR